MKPMSTIAYRPNEKCGHGDSLRLWPMLITMSIILTLHVTVSPGTASPPTDSHNLIVFTTPSPENRVCTVHVDTKVVNCITDPPEESNSDDRFPVWSPDGTRIAFQRHSFAGSFIGCAIYTIKFDGSELANVSGPTYQCYSRPEWSPDGTKLSFHTAFIVSGTIIRGIDIATVNGDSHTVLTSTAACTGGASPWSPEGDKLALSCPYSTPPGIYLVNADGSNLSLLKEIPGVIRNVKWSPHGDRLLFVRFAVESQKNELWVVDKDGTNAILLHTSPVSGMGFNAAVWAPSGDKIAFDVPPSLEKAGDVFVITPDGTGLTNISQDPTYALLPTWSPDGSRLSFFSGRAIPSSGIFVMNADGSEQTNLNIMGGFPQWSPAAPAPATFPGFFTYVDGLADLPKSVRNSIVQKASDAQHLYCDVGNVTGALQKLDDLVNYIEAQTGKHIDPATAAAISGYVNNLIIQIQQNQDVCA